MFIKKTNAYIESINQSELSFILTSYEDLLMRASAFVTLIGIRCKGQKYLRGECRTLHFHIGYPRVSKNYRLYVKSRDHECSLRKLHLYKIFCLQKHVKIG